MLKIELKRHGTQDTCLQKSVCFKSDAMFEVLPDVSYTQRTVLKEERGTTMYNNSTNSAYWPREDDGVERVIFITLSFIFLFVGVLGNIAVIIYNIFLNHDKTPSSWLVTHLAFADLLVCLIIYPPEIVLSFLEEGRDEDLVFCKITFTTFYVSLFLSMMILLSITIDKYLYIAKPLKYPLIVRTRRTRILLSCIWLAALVQFALICIYIDTKECEREKCYFPTTGSPTTGSTTTHEYEREECVLPLPVVWLEVILELAAICVMTILNYKMFKIVKDQRQRMASEFVLQPQQSEQIQSEQNMTWLRHLATELKAMKTFAIIVGVLTFCFVPYIFMNVVWILGHDPFSDMYTTYLILLHLVGINSIANAFIYALRHKKYTRAYTKLFSSAWARFFPHNN